MSKKLEKVIVVKIGGSTLGEHDTTIEDAVQLQKQGRMLIIVHGGGKLITEWLDKLGMPTQFVQGQRVTDKSSLEVVVSVLAGLVNKEIVAAINKAGGKAVGISGVDGAFIQSVVKDEKLGYVGSVKGIDLALVKVLLEAGYVPVVAPIGLYSTDNKDETVLMLNINADTVAGEIASALGAERLIFLTDVDGVRNKSGKVFPRLSSEEAKTLMSLGVISGGMIPKIEACLRALPNTPVTHIIDGRQPHALLKEIKGKVGGTIISVK